MEEEAATVVKEEAVTIVMVLGIIVYIDNNKIWTNNGSIDEHLTKVFLCLQLLAKHKLKANLFKCDWAVTNTEFLGYDMTPTHCILASLNRRKLTCYYTVNHASWKLHQE